MIWSRRRAQDRRGLTLLEMMITMVLLGLFAAVVHESFIVGLRTVTAADERERIRKQLATAMDRITREASIASNVRNATATRFRFDADLDGDGSIEDPERRIDYEVESGDLMRDDDDAPNIDLIPDLTTATFTYIDLNGNSRELFVNQRTRGSSKRINARGRIERYPSIIRSSSPI